ncbi:methyl-accepting chemotaxis protein [Sphingomonas sp. CJ20]
MLAFIDNWRLAKKMLVSFAILALLTGGLALNGYISNKTLTRVAATHVEQGVKGISGLADLLSDVKELRIIVYSYYAAVDPKDMQKLEERLAKTNKELDEAVADYAKIAGDDFAADVTALSAMVATLHQTDARIFAQKKAGDMEGALKTIKGDGKDASTAAREQINKLLEASRTRAEAANVSGNATATFSLLTTIALAVLSFLGLGFIWLMINRTVADPLARLTDVTKTLAEGGTAEVPYRNRDDELGQIASAVEQFRSAALSRAEIDARLAAEQSRVTTTLNESLSAMAHGDLTASIDADFPPAYAELKGNFNEALSSLRDLIGSVIESTSSIRTGSGEIAQASEDLARRTEANAASLEETSAAITQMDQRLKATAASAGRTVERADGAISTVSGGRSIADEAVQAMTRVSESAKGIDSVIEGLDKIAFQTRVLAMNAAVEAGRAGEAGRGFAVVADLVSALAMRAEEEAGRARDQLTATQTDIVAAVDMVQKVDGALVNISSDVSEVHSLLSTIATDNQAQSTAITQVSAAIGAMDHSTQQNAAMVEETSAAARNLSTEVSTLADQATRFVISANGARPANRPAARPAAVAKPAAQAKPTTSAGASNGYVSPVKALPAAVLGAGGGGDDWTAF